MVAEASSDGITVSGNGKIYFKHNWSEIKDIGKISKPRIGTFLYFSTRVLADDEKGTISLMLKDLAQEDLFFMAFDEEFLLYAKVKGRAYFKKDD